VAEKNDTRDETVLAAHITVHLVSGQAFELLPFMDEKDVKSKVTDLLEEWSKSGFLVRGSHIVPWHQVQWVEATRVEEISRAEAEQRLSAFAAKDPAQYQQAFWKTKESRKKEKKEEKGEDNPPRAA
jgi:hypothetical protein